MASPKDIAPVQFKKATEPWEFQQVARLNYQTFVEEIPQHRPNPERILIDELLNRSTCFICVEDRRVLGMVAVCGERPFSLDRKLECLDDYLPPGRRVCEIRLLAVERRRRGGLIFAGLLKEVACHCREMGYELAVISAAGSQMKLYRNLGFVPFGPSLGTPQAPYQGMYLTWDRLGTPVLKPLNLLPGPVPMDPSVKEALAAPPISHRGPEFLRLFENLRLELAELVHASGVEILTGSGTLANDCVAAQLSLRSEPGLILVNGEFGERLVDHARCFDLRFETLSAGWGEGFDCEEIDGFLARRRQIGWLWSVHCETSTGVLNDLEALKRIARQHSLLLCLDCISSIGSVPLDLSDVHLATGVSGKALGSFAGLAMVFHAHRVVPSSGLPRYLDIGRYASNQGVPFTLSSTLVSALAQSLKVLARDGNARAGVEHRYRQHCELATWLRQELTRIGWRPLTPKEIASPAVLTLVVDSSQDSVEIGQNLERGGFLLSYRSEYLVRRNLIQICLMGRYRRAQLKPLVRALAAAGAES